MNLNIMEGRPHSLNVGYKYYNTRKELNVKSRPINIISERMRYKYDH